MTNRYLYLMRHGLARSKGLTDDFQKPLSAIGKKDVRAQMEKFRQTDGIRPDCILCSTAVRAQQTVELLSELFVGTPVFFRESLYLAPAFRVLELIRETDTLFHRIMIVGHNPGLEQLIPILTTPLTRPTLQPADCASLLTDTPDWKSLTTGRATLDRFFQV